MLVIRHPKHREYLESILSKASGAIRLIDPVPLEQVADKLNEYDIGIHRIDNELANHRFAMPNKIFEFIQGRLAVVTTPNPDMKRLIESTKIGKTPEDFSIKSMADLINSLTFDEINKFKKRSHDIAGEFSAEVAQAQYSDMVYSIFRQGNES